MAAEFSSEFSFDKFSPNSSPADYMSTSAWNTTMASTLHASPFETPVDNFPWSSSVSSTMAATSSSSSSFLTHSLLEDDTSLVSGIALQHGHELASDALLDLSMSKFNPAVISLVPTTLSQLTMVPLKPVLKSEDSVSVSSVSTSDISSEHATDSGSWTDGGSSDSSDPAVSSRASKTTKNKTTSATKTNSKRAANRRVAMTKTHGDDDDDDYTSSSGNNEKLSQRERNREAASRYRDRKKQKTQEMEEKVENLHSKLADKVAVCEQLANENRALKDQLRFLKNLLSVNGGIVDSKASLAFLSVVCIGLVISPFVGADMPLSTVTSMPGAIPDSVSDTLIVRRGRSLLGVEDDSISSSTYVTYSAPSSRVMQASLLGSFVSAIPTAFSNLYQFGRFVLGLLIASSLVFLVVSSFFNTSPPSSATSSVFSSIFSLREIEQGWKSLSGKYRQVSSRGIPSATSFEKKVTS